MTKLNPCTRELLTRAKMVDGPPRQAKARIYRALTATAAGSAVTLGATAAEASLKAAATSSSVLTLLTTGKVGLLMSVTVGLVSGTLVLASVGHFAPSAATPKPNGSVHASHAIKSASLSPAAVPSAPSVVVSAEELPLEVDVAKVTPPPSIANSSPIAEETRLLAKVQQALREGDGQSALVLLGRYRRDFGKGALREEALAAEVFARCAVGDISGAAKARAQFRRTFAGSPLEPRVESSCPNSADNAQ